MKDKMFWFLLIFGLVLFMSSFAYYLSKCTVFETCWFACTILECRVSSLVGIFSLGMLIATISLWLERLTEEVSE
jgi:hypothetical protein